MNQIITDEFLVHLTGNHQILIENYKGIQSYNTESICINGNHMILKIFGKDLSIQYYSYEAMKVMGTILKLEYI